jgi:hypothetical protein
MVNKKTEIDAKAKAAPAVPPLEAGQQTKTSETKVPVVPLEPVAVEKKEKEKKAQAAKKAGKGQQTIVKTPTTDQAEVPIEAQPTAPSEAKTGDGEAKAKKVKAAKVKKQAAVEMPPVVAETTPVPKAGAPAQASEKATKMKRLTLDIAKPLHKAIKAKAVEEGVPMVDMLRSLLEEHYSQ